MSIRSYYPTTRPSYIINFSKKTLLNSGVRFTRGGGGTYVDENGLIVSAIPDQPRFNHNPETLEYEGLLIEAAGTNNVLNSENPSLWNNFRIATGTDTIVAPDGISKPIYYIQNTSTVDSIARTGTASTTNGNSSSVFLKARSGSTWVAVGPGQYSSGSNGWNVYVNLADGSIGTIGSQLTYSSIKVTKLPNDWYRVEINNHNNQFVIANNALYVAVVEGNGVKGTPSGGTHSYYVWGGQFEDGSSSVSSYIPTSGSTVTRAADLISVSSVSGVKSGRIKFSSATSNSYLPYFSLKDSALPAKPYVLELGSVNSAPVASVVYNSVRQGTTSIPSVPGTGVPSESTLSFNFEPTTGAVEISSTASDDADSHVLSLPAELSRPLPSDQTLNLLSVESKSVPLSLKEIYLWETALTIDQLASVSGELRSIGQPVEASTGLNENSDYADVGARPTLDLRFAERKDLFDDTTEQNLVTFSRGGVATYTDENGVIQTAVADEPRFDHNPTTGECLGMLVEEARTNLATYGEVFMSWAQSNIIVLPNCAVSPSKTFAANKLVANNSNAQHLVSTYSPFTLASYTSGIVLSCYAKAAENTRFAMGWDSNTLIVFDLAGGTIVSTVNGYNFTVSGTIQSIPNGWYHCSIFLKTNGTALNSTAKIWTTNSSGSISYAGDGISGIYIWGAQIEAGSFPTSYIPTPATFTSRASIATYYDATGTIQTALADEARDNAYFPDENGVMRPAGLLLEESRTNLLIYSNKLNEFFTRGSAYGGGYGGGWQNDPADITELSDSYGTYYNTTHNLVWSSYGTCNTSSSTNYVVSFFAKSSTIANIRPKLYGNTTGTVSTGSYVSLQTGGVLYPGGWRKFTFIMPTTSNSGNSIVIELSTGSGFDIKNIQVEQGSYPTSYIPTTSAAVTRAADVSSSATVTRSADVAQITGSNFSSWYNQSEGTTFVHLKNIKSQNFSLAPFIAYDGNNNMWDSNQEYGLRYNSSGTTMEAVIRDSSAGTVSLTRGGDVRTETKAVIALNSTQFALTRDGGSVSTVATLGPISSITRFTLSTNVGPQQSTHFSRLTYWPQRLPDATLQVLTDPAISTWDLIFDSSLSSNGTCAVVTASTCTYTIDWGDGTPVQTVNATGTGFEATHRYTFPQTYKAKIEVLSGAFRPYYNDSIYADQLVEIGPSPDGWTNTSTSGFGTTLNAAWSSANNLRVVDRELNTSSITDFYAAWDNCTSLTSFPLLDTSSGTTFNQAWRICTSLTSFPANFFDSWTGTPVNNCFVNAWGSCTSLTATSVENILNSIDTSGRSAPAFGVDITIDYNAGSGTPNVATAVANLKGRGWTITLNGTLQ